MKLASFIAAVSIGAFPALTLPTAAADAPTVDSILAKHIEASGGKEAMEKIHSRQVQFKLESETLGNSDGEIFAQAPDHQRSHVDMGAAGVVDEGCDGTVAWVKNPWEGLRARTGEELEKFKRDARFNGELKLKSTFPDLACKGAEKVGDEDAWLLESKPSAATKERLWFSAKTGLLLRRDSEYPGPQGVVNLSVLLRDHKVFDGVKMPTTLKMKISVSGQEFEFTMKFLTVKHNVPIDAAKFTKPAE